MISEPIKTTKASGNVGREKNDEHSFVHDTHDRIRLRAADELFNFVHTATAQFEALIAIVDDPATEVRDLVHLVLADLRGAVEAPLRDQLTTLLSRVEYARLSPGDALRRLDAFVERTRAERDGSEGLLRFAVAARRVLRQTTPLVKETLDTIVSGVGHIESESLASCDVVASENGSNHGGLVTSLLRGANSTSRPEWKAACDASHTALEIFKRLETKLPMRKPWWKSVPTVPGVALLLLVVGILIGALVFRAPGTTAAASTSTAAAAVEETPAPSAPTPPPVEGLHKVIVIGPEALTRSAVATELMARCEQVLHGAGLREKDKPIPTIEVLPYDSSRAALSIASDYLTSAGVEPVLSRMSRLKMLGGADHAAVIRPLRQQGKVLTVAVTLVRLGSTVSATEANGTEKPADEDVAVRIWSDVWSFHGVLEELEGRDPRALRIQLVGVENAECGRVVAEVLWRQANATAEDYAIAAAYYLAGVDAKSPEAARGREILWAGYSRYRSELLAKFLLGVEKLPIRLALAEAHPTVLNGPDRHGFTTASVDESQASARYELVQAWAKELIHGAFDGR